MFHVGQHVVCVDLRPNKRGFFPRYSDTVIPVLRGIYTVRRIFDAKRYGYDAAGVLLTEIVNPVRRYITPEGRRVRVEQFFLASRFRPVKRTSIEVFPAPAGAGADAPAGRGGGCRSGRRARQIRHVRAARCFVRRLADRASRCTARATQEAVQGPRLVSPDLACIPS